MEDLLALSQARRADAEYNRTMGISLLGDSNARTTQTGNIIGYNAELGLAIAQSSTGTHYLPGLGKSLIYGQKAIIGKTGISWA